MKGALLSGNIETALTYLVAVSRDRYRQVFTDLGSIRINSIFSSISEFKLDTLYLEGGDVGSKTTYSKLHQSKKTFTSPYNNHFL